MSTAAILGLIGGLLVGVGVYLTLHALGYFQYLGGKRRSSIPAVNRDTLIGRLLHLNDLAKPYSIVEGKGTDLIAEWKIVDAAWYGIFSKSHFRHAYRAYLLVDEARHTVRCYEEIGAVDWVKGNDGLRPIVHYPRGLFRGRQLKRESARAYAVKTPAGLEAGKGQEYCFDIDTIRQPIVSVVRESGWEWVPVVAKRHAVYKTRPAA